MEQKPHLKKELGKVIIVGLDCETWKFHRSLKVKKGQHFLDFVRGIIDNIQPYVEEGDTLIIPKMYFNKQYTFRVLEVSANNNGEPYAKVQSNEYIPKKVLEFLNTLAVRKFNKTHHGHNTIKKAKKSDRNAT